MNKNSNPYYALLCKHRGNEGVYIRTSYGSDLETMIEKAMMNPGVECIEEIGFGIVWRKLPELES